MRSCIKHILHVGAFLLVLAMAVFLAGHYLMPHSNRYLSGYTAGGILGEDFDTIDDWPVLAVATTFGQQIIQIYILFIGYHEVDSRPSADHVVVLVVDNDVVAGATKDGIRAVSTVQVVVAAHAKEQVITGTAE